MTSFRDIAEEDVKSAASNNDGEEQETLEQIEVDFDEASFVKFYPTSLPNGTFPEDEGNPIIRFPDADNNDGRRDQGYLGLVMDDISVVTDEDEGMDEVSIIETGASDTTEFRVVDFSDDRTKRVFGGDGVSIDGDKYEITEEHNEIEGRSILIVDRTASKSVARTLDANGATYAGMDEETGQVNGGLIEYAPDDEETGVGSRYARNPELRDELYGATVGVLVSRRSNADSGATGYLGRDGEANDGEAVVEMSSVPVGEDGDTHTDPSRATYEELVAADERRDMMWYTVFDMETGDKLEPVEGEPVGYSYLEWRFDPTAGNLPEEDWQFVQQYIDSGAPQDEENILTNIEKNMDELSDDPNTERMVALIQNEAGQ
jgi:hypothetical protein